MPIEIACPKCGCLLYTPMDWAGEEIVCPGCGTRVSRTGADERLSSRAEPVQVDCPHCKAPLRVVPSLVGRRVVCNRCHTGLLVSLTVTKAELSPIGRGGARQDQPTPSQGTSPGLETQVTCKCGKRLKIPGGFAGQSSKCPNCGSMVIFPAADARGPAGAPETSEIFLPADPESDVAGPIPAPKEVGIALRDSRIQTILRTLASGEQLAENLQPAESRRAERQPPEEPPPPYTPAWFWPLVVAMAATCTMLVVLVVLTFVP